MQTKPIKKATQRKNYKYNQAIEKGEILMTLKTDRLILRLFDDNDVDSYYNILKNKSVYQWLGKGEKKTKIQIKKIINYHLDHWQKHKIGTWAVVLKEDNTLIGHCGFNYVKDLNHYELLYAFEQSQWGKGYATEACKVSLSWVKNNKITKELIALSYPNNKPSIHVIEKLGFNYIETKSLFGLDLFVYQIKIESLTN